MKSWKRLVLIASAYVSTMVIAACVDSTTQPQIAGLPEMKPRFDWYTTEQCASITLRTPINPLADPDTFTVRTPNASSESYDYSYDPSSGVLTSNGWVCHSVDEWYPGPDYCQANPYEPGCTVYPELPPDDWGTFYLGTPGGGSTYTGPPTPPFTIKVSDCNYKFWRASSLYIRDSLKTCQVRFDQEEKDTLITLGNRLFRRTQDTVWADTVAQRECKQMKFWFNAMLADTSGKFGKGNTNSAHMGAAHPELGSGIGHVDPRMFEFQLDKMGASKLHNDRMLLMVTVHETTHAFGAKDHLQIESWPYYMSSYFLRLNDFNMGGSCIK